MSKNDLDTLMLFNSVWLYILCFNVVISNSGTATLWKLNPEHTRIIEAKSSQFQEISASTPMQQQLEMELMATKPYDIEDSLFRIITSTEGENWTKQTSVTGKSKCNVANKRSLLSNNTARAELLNNDHDDDEEVLDCGKPVNFTYYDNLIGVMNRGQHPSIPEPEAALTFAKKYRKSNNVDLETLERRLKCAKRDKPKSVQLYNQIGNYWRIKGNAERAIECFRRALAVSPHNAEVLLNLARQLLTLHYLDDAIYLTRRSLEVQPPEKNAWHQYFTLGEIFKIYGHYQEATAHLRHSLELNPGYAPAIAALKEMESLPTASIHVYTLVIIICLCLGVLLVILSSVDNFVEQEELKPQRHFNKAMAMRHLRGFRLTAQKRVKKNIF